MIRIVFSTLISVVVLCHTSFAYAGGWTQPPG